MLRDLRDAVQHHYYDPQYHGVDLEARFKSADQRLQSVTNLGDAMMAIAETLDALKDSHTFFLPPSRNTHREYGYIQQMIGDRCFITAVRPNRDASEKLAPGDEVVAWQGYAPKRENLWTMNYIFNTLLSVPAMNLTVRGPDGVTRKVEVEPKVTREKQVLDLNDPNDYWKMVRDEENGERENRQRLVNFGDKLLIWKMPEFFMTDDEVDRLIKDARKYQALVMDLRGNPGGLIKTLERVVGDVVDHDVTIARRVGRKSDLKPQIAKSRGANAYAGKLIVLGGQPVGVRGRAVRARHSAGASRDGARRSQLGLRHGVSPLPVSPGREHHGLLRRIHHRRRSHHGRRQESGAYRRGPRRSDSAFGGRPGCRTRPGAGQSRYAGRRATGCGKGGTAFPARMAERLNYFLVCSWGQPVYMP